MPVNTSNNQNEGTGFARSESSLVSTAIKLLKGAIKQLVNGECPDDEIAHTISKLSSTTNGYCNPDNYVTVDQGMKLMCMGQNRVGFIKLMKKNNIHCEYFNNAPIGYPKDKVLIIRNRQQDEYKAKKAKLKTRNYNQ